MSETIPKGWTNTTYSEVLSRRKETHTNNGTYPLYSLTIEKGVTPKSDRYEREFLVRDKEAKKYAVIYPNDLVFNPSNLRWGAIARSKVSFKVLASPIYEICEPNIRKITPEYLGYLATSDLMMRRYLQFVQGTLVERTGLHIDDFLPIPISIPSLTEQQKIAEILTSVDEVIENTQSQINKLEDLKKATMNELLTRGIGHTEFKETEIGRIPKSWKLESLKRVATVRVSNVDKKIYEGEKRISLCNYMDVYKNRYLTNKNKYMLSTASEREIKQYGLRRGDLVVTKDSESPDDIGRPALIDETVCDLVCGYHLAIIRSDAKIVDANYLLWWLQSNYVAKWFYINANGTTRFGLPTEAIESLPIPLPSPEEQGQIGRIGRDFTGRLMFCQEKKEQQIALKKSLMQDLLTGKVRVTVN